MKVAITGASGLIGSALVPQLQQAGHHVVRLVRHAPSGPDEMPWIPSGTAEDVAQLADRLSGVDAVVHLAGVGIGDKRWTKSYRHEVLHSRTDGTATIARAVALTRPRPEVLLSASAVGWYGDTGDRVVDEAAPSGSGFLAEVTRQWEAAAAPAQEAGIRVAFLRSGVVLARNGGLLGRTLLLYRWGLGGRLGSGRQYLAWVSLPDELRAIEFLLTSDVRGPVNIVAPTPATNAEFTRALGRALHRPTPWRVPGVALRIALGGFATEGILAGQAVVPGVLEAAGFNFELPTLDVALPAVLRDRAG